MCGPEYGEQGDVPGWLGMGDVDAGEGEKGCVGVGDGECVWHFGLRDVYYGEEG